MKVLMGFVMLAAAAGTVIKKFLLNRELERARAWPSTDGEITQSKIAMKSGNAGFDNANKTYKAEVTYKYTAGKRSYRNSKICIGGQLQLSLRGKAEDYCQKYPVGQAVTVHYNPDDPKDSCLELREETSGFYLLAGAVFAVIGFVFITG